MTDERMVAQRDGELDRLDGLWIGALNAGELALFEQACRDYRAYRSYVGVGGFLGLGKVAVVRKKTPSNIVSDEP